MAKLIPIETDDLKLLLERLDLDGLVDVVYERSERDNLHLWLLWDGFEDLNQIERHDRFKHALSRTPDRTLLRITLIFPMTHAEFVEDFEVNPNDFPAPSPDPTEDGPFRLTKEPAHRPA
jgi:hypothetical protein